jgi:glycosyltransferase involved in cell wall biosynthesis
MKVLHLPTNVASIPSHTVRGLREIGVDARGLVFENTMVQSGDGLKILNSKGMKRCSISRVRMLFVSLYYFVKEVVWADVIHWYCGSSVFRLEFDLKLIKLMKKPAVVEFLGSEVRIPEIEFSDNSFYREAFQNGYEYQTESYGRSRQLQKLFYNAGFVPITIIGMKEHIQKDIYPQVHLIKKRIMVSDFSPSYPDPHKLKPLIIHAPSTPICKGTPAVLRAVEHLKKAYDFEFALIQGQPRRMALRWIKEADIFLDQFIIGHYGMAALEAMAYGKPVVCYIKPSLLAEYPADLPIVNANPETLPVVLEKLVKDGSLRYEIGRRSRQFVEKYHDSKKLAYELVGIYQELMRKKRPCK